MTSWCIKMRKKGRWFRIKPRKVWTLNRRSHTFSTASSFSTHAVWSCLTKQSDHVSLPWTLSKLLKKISSSSKTWHFWTFQIIESKCTNCKTWFLCKNWTCNTIRLTSWSWVRKLSRNYTHCTSHTIEFPPGISQIWATYQTLPS